MTTRLMVPLTELDSVTHYTGGVGKRYLAMIPELANRVDKLTIIVVSRDVVPQPARNISGARLKIVRIPKFLPGVLDVIIRAVVVAMLSLRNKYDYILAPEWGGVAALIPKRRSTRLVTNLVTGIDLARWIESSKATNSEVRRAPYSAGDRIQAAIERIQIRRSNHCVACSKAVLQWYTARNYVRKSSSVSVVRNCIDTERIKQAIASKDTHTSSDKELNHNLSHNAVREYFAVGFLGRLEYRKGIDSAISAFVGAALEASDIRFEFLGQVSGEDRHSMWKEEISSLPEETRSKFKFHGHVSGNEIYRTIAGLDAVVIPSLWEAFGNSVLEAWQCGTPVVTTSGSGFDDFCVDGDNCLTVPPGDSESIRKAVLQLKANVNLCSALAEHAAVDVAQYDCTLVARDLLAEVVNR